MLSFSWNLCRLYVEYVFFPTTYSQPFKTLNDIKVPGFQTFSFRSIEIVFVKGKLCIFVQRYNFCLLILCRDNADIPHRDKISTDCEGDKFIYQLSAFLIGRGNILF